MNIERTISIRKVIHIAEGIVRSRSRPGYAVDGEPIEVRDISCSVSVDVPVLTELPAPSFIGGFRSAEQVELEHRLREQGIEPDDEIGLLAGAVPVGCRFRRHTGVDSDVVVRRSERQLYDALYGSVSRGEEMLGIDSKGRALRTKVDTPVVVRVRDILPGYRSMEDK